MSGNPVMETQGGDRGVEINGGRPVAELYLSSGSCMSWGHWTNREAEEPASAL